MKTLILVADKKNYFFPYVKSDSVDIENFCRPLGRFEYQLMRLFRRFNISLPIFFDQWKKKLNKYDKVILFDMGFTPSLAKYTSRKSNAKIFVYLWNPVKGNSKMIKFISLAKKYAKIFSYDPIDVKNLNLNFAPMVYSKNVSLPKEKEKADLSFLGFAKDRLPTLKTLCKDFKKEDITGYFYLVGNSNENLGDIHISTQRKTYSDYLKMIASTRGILDLVQGGQSGLSLRVMESLFLKKKLITANENVANYDFYSSQNIFILGKDRISNLKNFLESPIEDIPLSTSSKYELESWVNHYFV